MIRLIKVIRQVFEILKFLIIKTNIIDIKIAI